MDREKEMLEKKRATVMHECKRGRLSSLSSKNSGAV